MEAPENAISFDTSRSRGCGRVSHACNRCRQQKVKCNGLKPCQRCERKSLSCEFDETPKVLVSQEFLAELQSRVGTAQRSPPSRDDFAVRVSRGASAQSSGNSDHLPEMMSQQPNDSTASMSTDRTASHSYFGSAAERGTPNSTSVETNAELHNDSEQQMFVNPMLNGAMAYITDGAGRKLYLGTSSNWAFARRVLLLLHDSTDGGNLPLDQLHFDGKAYSLKWNGKRGEDQGLDQSLKPLPSADFALFLINAVKFHCGQLYHLFDEPSFMQSFTRFHDANMDPRICPGLWYSHYNIILALGMTLIARDTNANSIPGEDLFTRGMIGLPDATFSEEDPLETMEILCCAATYLQCCDRRKPAYHLIGRALRLAFIEGIHTDMRDRACPQSEIERCRGIWWTVYSMDCHASALMGCPLSVGKPEVETMLPQLHGSPQRRAALGTHVALMEVLWYILQTIYGKHKRSSADFLSTIRFVLRKLADCDSAGALGGCDHTEPQPQTISRVKANLLLLRHQCVILATRPLLYSCLQRKLGVNQHNPIPPPEAMRPLLQACIAAAQHTIRTLKSVKEQYLLECALPFDLEALWSSAVVLLVAEAVDLGTHSQWEQYRLQVGTVFDQMTLSGNRVAIFRQTDILLIESAVLRLNNDPNAAGARSAQSLGDPGDSMLLDNTASLNEDLAFPPLDDQFSGEQLFAMAETLDAASLDWLIAGMPGNDGSGT